MEQITKTQFRKIIEDLPSSLENAGSQDDESDASTVQAGPRHVIAWAISRNRTGMKLFLEQELPEKLNIIMQQSFVVLDRYSQRFESIDFSFWENDRATLLEALSFAEHHTVWSKLCRSSIVQGQIISPIVVAIFCGSTVFFAAKLGLISGNTAQAATTIQLKPVSEHYRINGQVLVNGVPKAGVRVDHHRSGVQITDEKGKFILECNVSDHTDSLTLYLGTITSKAAIPLHLNTVRYNLVLPVGLRELAQR
ncbi:hypothetical protein DBR43_15135 [Pedobacter sp. KBW06]|uniref:hypothetical protein n=1 Tax=Pedobacter sp. KBW06 TaxID=2153359 RepID=UPI000F5A2BFC|nr:hypothetical protein [Pedobacter sp. KBW06]RQO69416.1 hypothetical protein DBR43_15135 [Pedobacter sp. KBW06]